MGWGSQTSRAVWRGAIAVNPAAAKVATTVLTPASQLTDPPLHPLTKSCDSRPALEVRLEVPGVLADNETQLSAVQESSSLWLPILKPVLSQLFWDLTPDVKNVGWR